MLELSPVERVASLSKDAFLGTFKSQSRPVVIEQLTRDWPARDKWTTDYLKSVAGDSLVPLYASTPARERKHQHAPAARMPLRDYLDRLSAGENDLRMFFYNMLADVPGLAEDFSFPDIGLKFFKKLPVLFVGGKGAKVQMHFDIDLADIFLCHFGGRKRVMLFAPDQTPFIYRVPFSFSALFDVKFDRPDFSKYPGLKHLQGQTAVLEHGDVLYIPPGYWHYVEYDDIGFSMSLRAFPRQPKNFARMMYNLVVLRSIEGFMRKAIGQRWNDRNERRAVEKAHRRLGLRAPVAPSGDFAEAEERG